MSQVYTYFDLGCGPGFPSIPLAIMRPDLSVVALDSTDKKVQFVAKSAEILQLSNLKATTGRAEAPDTRKALGLFDACVNTQQSTHTVIQRAFNARRNSWKGFISWKGHRFVVKFAMQVKFSYGK